jgi:hypothetical protein
MTTNSEGIIILKDKKTNTNITGTIVLNGTYTSDVNNGGSGGCCSNNYAYEDTTGNVFIRTNFDSFNRLRVSNLTTLFELNSIFGKNLHVEEKVSGSGVSTFDSSNSYIQMSLSDSGIGKIIRQSYEYIPYQPGKSRLMMFSGVLEINGGVDGSVSRIGCFDSNVDKTYVSGYGNGLFFELNGTTLYVVLRANDIDTKISQSNWNVDKLDGTGPSGYTITDWGKAYLFTIDQEWLGVGSVRFGIFINGKIVLLHSINNSGVGTPISSTIDKPYNKTAKLPIRFEISSTSAVNSEMRMMCGTVLSEGGFEPFGYLFSYPMETVKTVSSNNTLVLSIRMTQTEPKNRVSALLRSMDILNTSGGSRYILYKIFILNDPNAITGGSWVDVNTSNSVIQVNTTATNFNLSSGILLKSGYVGIKESSIFPYQEYLNSPLINSTIDGSSRILSLICKSLGGNADVYASLDWLEIQ